MISALSFISMYILNRMSSMFAYSDDACYAMLYVLEYYWLTSWPQYELVFRSRNIVNILRWCRWAKFLITSLIIINPLWMIVCLLFSILAAATECKAHSNTYSNVSYNMNCLFRHTQVWSTSRGMLPVSIAQMCQYHRAFWERNTAICQLINHKSSFPWLFSLL